MKTVYISLLFLSFLCMIGGCGQGKEAVTLQAKPQPSIRDEAIDFTLKNQDQLSVTLSDFRGERNVILVFYPLDFTPV